MTEVMSAEFWTSIPPWVWVVVAVVVLLLIGLLIFCCSNRRKRYRNKVVLMDNPYQRRDGSIANQGDPNAYDFEAALPVPSEHQTEYVPPAQTIQKAEYSVNLDSVERQ